MDKRIYQSSWSVDPLEWFVNVDGSENDPVTIEPGTRDAALQFSTYRKSNGNVTEEEIQSFASDCGLLDVACVVTHGPFSGLLATQVQGTTWWRHWWLSNGQVLLYVTYNSDISVQARDHLLANEILDTLQVRSV